MMQVETKHNRIIAGAGEYLAVCMKNAQYKKQAVTEFFLRIGLKNCNKCSNVKILDDFHKNKNSYNGLNSQCKNCSCSSTKKHYTKNIEHILNYNKLYRKENKQKISAQTKLYREKNKDYTSKRIKLYKEKNKDKTNEYNRTYTKLRAKSDPVFKLKKRVRGIIYASILLSGYTKKSRTHEILGCDFEFFMQHIERQFLPGMTWEKLGSEIHIDHIIPLASAKTEEEVIALNHFTNLRPCWAVENLRKSDSIEFLI